MDVTSWLLDADPAIRWQVLADLLDAPDDVVATERARVAAAGWGAALLAEQGADGRWDGGVYRPGWVDHSRPFFDAWTATHFSLQQLRDFGIDRTDPTVLAAIERVAALVEWEPGQGYFDGETEECVNGIVLANAAYFGQDGSRVLETLRRGQRADGGWNCFEEDTCSSVHSTLCVLEGLWAWERASGESTAALRAPAEEYLLERRLFRRLSTGEPIDPRLTMLSYPTRWYYDVLWALDWFRRARPAGDPRLGEAIEVVRSKRLQDGRWRLDLAHEGPTLFAFEGESDGAPSRWVTLRAMRVLRWWDDVG